MSNAPLPMFDLALRPIDQVCPWGDPPRIHYFALSEGASWIRVGNDELFRYTPEVLHLWHSEAATEGKSMDSFGEPYDSYYVIRLIEDLSTTFHHSLEPVPGDLIPMIDAINDWRQQVDAPQIPAEVQCRLQNQAGGPVTDLQELFWNATSWWGDRQLSTMHLKYQPRIHLWSDCKDMEIRWDTRNQVYKGVPVWTAQHGSHRIPVDALLREVQHFHDRFFNEMRRRIQSVGESWPHPEIAVDLKRLDVDREYFERQWHYPNALVAADTDWDVVRHALRQLRNA
jgi:hypothetical protein